MAVESYACLLATAAGMNGGKAVQIFEEFHRSLIGDVEDGDKPQLTANDFVAMGRKFMAEMQAEQDAETARKADELRVEREAMAAAVARHLRDDEGVRSE